MARNTIELFLKVEDWRILICRFTNTVQFCSKQSMLTVHRQNNTVTPARPVNIGELSILQCPDAWVLHDHRNWLRGSNGKGRGKIEMGDPEGLASEPLREIDASVS